MGLWKPVDECLLTGLWNPSMYLAAAFSAWGRDCHATCQTRSDLMVLKKVRRIRKQSSGLFSRRKTIEVSQQFPRPRILCRQAIACKRREGDQGAASAEQRLIADRAVLRSAVGMVNQPRRGAAREEVQDDSEGEPAPWRPDVGDVRPPLPVRAIRREVLRHQVRGDGPGMFAVRHALEAPLLPRDQRGLAHQPRRAMAPDISWPFIDEIAMHPRAAAGAVRQGEGRPDMRRTDQVLLPAATGRTVLARAKKPLWPTPRTRHIRRIGKQALAIGLEPTAPRWLVPLR